MTGDSTEPQPDPDELRVSAQYQGNCGQDYADTVQRYRASEGVINHDKFAGFVHPNDTVLDFGCASGSLLLTLDAAERIGIEVNPATRSEAERAGLRTYGSIRSIRDQSIDVALSNHALEHVLDPFEALLELRRVLRSTGRLVICVPADDWRNARQWRPDDPNHHVFAWTPLTLGNLLTEAGFDPVSVTMRHRAWPRNYVQLHRRLPRPLWEAVCLAWAIGRRRREIIAVAVPRTHLTSGPVVG